MSFAASTRHPCIVCILTACSIFATSACGSDADRQVTSPETTATPPDSAPAESAASTIESEPTATAPTTTASPGTTIPAEPIPVREAMSLTAGWPYATQNLSVPFSFSIPSDENLGRWRMLFDTSNYMIVTLNLADKEDPDIEREEPGVAVFALPEGLGAADFLTLWSGYAAEQESFTVEVSDGAYLGGPATVLSGTYQLGEPADGAYLIRLGDSMNVPVASGERTYLAYLVEVGDRTIMVQINAHELDFGLNVTLVNQIADTIEFTEAGP